MASTRIVEVERGTYTGRLVHPHNGYFAGDFHATRQPTVAPARPPHTFAPGLSVREARPRN